MMLEYILFSQKDLQKCLSLLRSTVKIEEQKKLLMQESLC